MQGQSLCFAPAAEMQAHATAAVTGDVPATFCYVGGVHGSLKLDIATSSLAVSVGGKVRCTLMPSHMQQQPLIHFTYRKRADPDMADTMHECWPSLSSSQTGW